MRIIPAIDIMNGKCVRLTEGDFSQKRVYSSNPVSAAECFRDAGAQWIHVVDLEGAREGKVVNWKTITDLLSLPDLSIQFGGGIRTSEEASRLLSAGVKRIVVGTHALRMPEIIREWSRKFGPEHFCIAVDVKNGLLLTNAWQTAESRTMTEVVGEFQPCRIKSFLCTDVARDGRLSSPNTEFYRDLVNEFPGLLWLASGGVSNAKQLVELQETGVAGVIVGKAFYEGNLSLNEIKNFQSS